MANTILQSMGRFNQFLAREVEKKDFEDRRDLINQTGAEISRQFMELGPGATPRDVSRVTFEAMAAAGDSGTLPENMSIINALGSQSMGLSKYETEQRDFSQLANTLAPMYGLEGEFTELSGKGRIQAMAATEATTKTVNRDVGASAFLTTFRKDARTGEPKQNFNVRVGPSKQAISEQTNQQRLQLEFARGTSAAKKELAKQGNREFKHAPYVAAEKSFRTKSSDIAIDIMNEFDPEQKKFDYPDLEGGASGRLKWLMSSAPRMAKLLGKTDLQEDITALEFQGSSFIDAHGTRQGGSAAVPTDQILRDKFIQFIQMEENADAMQDVMINNLAPQEPFTNSAAADKIAQDAYIEKLETNVESGLSTPEDPNHIYLKKLVYTITGNDKIQASEQYKSLTEREKNSILYVVNKEFRRQMELKQQRN